ncbi:MAG: GPP34 family phosphoprotein [Iphinoe sp. HA4291-MV1]|jgi:hypothetical protein|nr:GPP34 family phosphoprotein [Iphinoe sp. HA4291-MV1]
MQYLAQDLMLLALNNQTGKIRFSASSALSYSLMGAVLLDLVLQGKLIIDHNSLIVVDANTTGDDFFDQCLNEVLTAQRPRMVNFWVKHWGSKYSGFQKVVLQNLVELGVLTQQEQRVLWIFRVQRYFLTDASIQRAIIDRVRAAVLENIGLHSRTAALMSLIQACQLTDSLFTPEERRKARPRIQAIANGELVGKAVSDTVAGVQAALSASMTAAIVASTASSSSSNS